MALSLADDPYNWDVDQVVEAFCRQDPTQLTGLPASVLPAPDRLERILRNNDIYGSLLLTAVDDALLRELQITSVGQRFSILQAITQLRKRSLRYGDEHRTFMDQASAFGRDNSISPRPPMSSPSDEQQPSFPAFARPAFLGYSPSPYRHPPYFQSFLPHGNPSTSGTQGRLDRQPMHTPDLPEPRLPDQSASIGELRRNSRSTPGSASNSPQRPDAVAETDEDYFVDVEDFPMIPTPAATPSVNKLQPGLVYRDSKGRKRLAPQPVADSELSSSDRRASRSLLTPEKPTDTNFQTTVQTALSKPDLLQAASSVPRGSDSLKSPARVNIKTSGTNTSLVGRPDGQKRAPKLFHKSQRGYLGPHAFPVERIFYGDTSFGQEIRHDSNLSGSTQEPPEQPEFSFMSSDYITNGQRLYVHQMLKHFLSRAERSVFVSNGKSFAGVQPYPGRIGRRFQPPSFTLFSAMSDTTMVATREDTLRWPAFKSDLAPEEVQYLDPSNEGPQFSGLSDGDPILQSLEKYRDMENVTTIPAAFGESGSEGEYDSETWNEIEQERGETEKPVGKTSRAPLSREDVFAAIDLGIEDLVNKWKQQKLPKLEMKAWGLWKKSRRDHTKRESIRLALGCINQICNQRIPKMSNEIAGEVWTTSLQVRKQCRIMEQSVFDRESDKWAISVYKSATEPQRRPMTLPKRKKPPRPDAHGSEDEEVDLVESDFDQTDDSSDEAGMEDFIVGDDADDEVMGDNQIPANDADDEEAMDLVEEDDSEEDVIASSSKQRKHRSAFTSLPTLPTSPIHDPDATPSGYVDRASRETSKPSYTAQKVVDLTMTSEDSGAEATVSGSKPSLPSAASQNRNPFRDPFSTPSKRKVSRPSSVVVVDDLPAGEEPTLDYNDIKDIAFRSYEFYKVRNDRKGLLVKVLYHMNPEWRRYIITQIMPTGEENSWLQIRRALAAIRVDIGYLTDMDDEAFENISKFARLFLMWWECRKTDTARGFRVTNLNKASEDAVAFCEFFAFLHQSLQCYQAPLRGNGVGEKAAFKHNVMAMSKTLTPNKKRKRKVVEDEGAKSIRESDRQRVREQVARARELKARLDNQGSSLSKDSAHIVVNPAKLDDQDFIYINPEIGSRIKSHQTEGVRFMWRELTTGTETTRGCLLAHTMGLGKTMQIITLLVTIAEAAASTNPRVSSQVPPSLQKSKTLILCPPTLIDNWTDEILLWAPRGFEDVIGALRKIDSLLFKTQDRLAEVAAWHQDGGILLISYQMFRGLVQNKSRSDKPAALNQDEHTSIRDMLLNGPNIIVADEAHLMKNPRSGIAVAASQFRSTSRIALTGSPIANNLEEYHSMIDWVAPGWLGPLVEFRARYVEPIREGLFSESTADERRLSAIRLRVLKEDLETRVHRAEISALKSDLPPKTEFVIKIPLTKLQERAYGLYVQSIGSGFSDAPSAHLLGWLAILGLLCNHPVCFKDKLLAREAESQKASQNLKKARVEPAAATSSTLPDEDGLEAVLDTAPGDASVTELGVPEALIGQQMKLFDEYGGSMDDISHSHRVRILDQLLEAAIQAGDKTLVFSHCLPTLKYVERLLIKTGRRYCRLTGETKMGDRQRNTKEFNVGTYDVYLISTRAGGLGLNLTGANRVVIFDFTFNPIWEEQAVGRAYRIHQTKPVFVYRFTAGGTFEERVHNRAIFKLQLASRVVDKKNPMRRACKYRDLLFKPEVVPQKDLSEFKGKDPLVLDKILARQTWDQNIRSIELTETYHKDDVSDMTAEDEKQAEQILKEERLKRSDPSAYQKLKNTSSQGVTPNPAPIIGSTPTKAPTKIPEGMAPLPSSGTKTKASSESPPSHDGAIPAASS